MKSYFKKIEFLGKRLEIKQQKLLKSEKCLQILHL